METGRYWDESEGLATARWDDCGEDLAVHGLAASHAAARKAYSGIRQLNGDATKVWRAMEAHYDYDAPPGMCPPVEGNEATLEEAVSAITRAEAVLNEEMEARSTKAAA